LFGRMVFPLALFIVRRSDWDRTIGFLSIKLKRAA
jgi:hypothetical protein